MEIPQVLGAEAGWQIGEASARDNLLKSLNAQEKQQQLQFNKQNDPLILQLNQAKAQQEQLRAKQDKRLAEIMQGKQPRDNQTASGMLADLIDANAGAGKWGEVEEMLPKYVEVVRKVAEIEKVKTDQDHVLLENYQKRMESIGSILNGVNDKASMDAAVTQIEQLTGRPFQVPTKDGKLINARDLPYSPELIEKARAKTMKVKEYTEKVRKDRSLASTEKNRADLARHRKFLEDLRKQKQKDDEAKEERLSKHGKSVTSPTQTEIDQADRLIRAEFPDLKGSEATTAAYSIASLAKQMHADTPALSMDQAIRRALEEKKKDGSFMTITKPGGLFGLLPGEKKQEFKPKPEPKKLEEPIVKQMKAEEPIKATPLDEKPAPSDSDRAWVKKHPESKKAFIEHFGVEP